MQCNECMCVSSNATVERMLMAVDQMDRALQGPAAYISTA